jgi:hypothetical protein
MIACEACLDTGFQRYAFLAIPPRQVQAMHQPIGIFAGLQTKVRDVPCPACSPDLHHNYLEYCYIKDMKEAGYGETYVKGAR